MIDTLHKVETPEGIVLHLKAAGCGSRGAAWFIDLLIRMLVYFVVLIGLGILGSFTSEMLAQAASLIFVFFFEWFYPVYFEVFRNGQTPGKKKYQLRVVSHNGTAVGWQPSIIRNFLRIVDMLPFFYGFGLLSCFCDKSFRRFGDIAAGTLVVYSEEQKRQQKKLREIEAETPSVKLTEGEEAAILTFTEKAEKLSARRQQELAELLSPVHDRSGEYAVETIHAYAAGILGHDETKSV